MNSWAKVIREAHKQGFEVWGLFGDMSVYKDGKLVMKITSLKQLKSLLK